jgi:hypothetical protein
VRKTIQTLIRKTGCSAEEIIRMITEIIDKTGNTAEQAQAILEGLCGNESEVRKTIESLDTGSLYVVKCRFKGLNTKSCGLLFLLLDVEGFSLKKLDVLVSYNPWLTLYDVDADWERFERYINTRREAGVDVVKELTQRLEFHLKGVFQVKEKKDRLFQALNKGLLRFHLKEFEEELKREICVGLTDPSVEILRIFVQKLRIPAVLIKLRRAKFLGI